ncbi:hypothetical protein [Mycobacteroides abscessus]|uniref:hypothetical protein n=1 Tax=Mycobacteroides abscessus TaxID=36809 RepID=UPI0005E6E8EE|nr:hypothetical protein [Mycobacteroides abscessus]CPS05613.1 Uncharacterised protein [Mycobacteroides abscessus]CPS17598.1 Uncharacterised protein [Mycobacteroides abscessus]CPS22748.1 Uncharacterised protein [Mycobacteroides abscessus]CPS90631.1 Uncharacterised protein [Mycobacteroides abscessus]CPT45579.1 Uncharacterised protein [Mycobacteroides abscessus]
MSFNALVLQVLLSAPSDLPQEHKTAIQRAIRLWNHQQARFYGIHFSPTDWKEGGTPSFGEYAQGVLNEQIVDESDAAIVVFTDRLGQATKDHPSGTAEEIHHLRAASKEVAIIRNNMPRAPLSGSALDERMRLDNYLKEIGNQAFLGDYDTTERLSEIVAGLLTRIAGRYRRNVEATLVKGGPDGPAAEADTDSGYDSPSKGVWPRIEVGANSKWRLVLESNLDEAVSNVKFHYENESGNTINNFDLRASRHGNTSILPPRGSVSFPIMQAWQSPKSAICVVDWTDPSGQQRSTRASVRTL